MEFKPGYNVTLPVERKTNFGYFLKADSEDILLHNHDVTTDIEVGQKINVFLYHDHEGRLAATMEEPIISVGEYAWLEVVGVRTGHGVFLFNGIRRDLFLSMDELPSDRGFWPVKGDKLPVTITWDKRGRMMAKLLRGKPIEEQATEAPETLLNEEVSGFVYHYLDDGALLLSKEGYLGFIHHDEMTEKPRYGQFITGRVAYVRPDGRINLSLKPIRSVQQKEDSERIFSYLIERGGAMPYSDKSNPDDIKARFQLSKGAFKRALGKLLKEGKIEQKDGWTYAKEQK
ncbi:S1 RNA-binding domain-containing protein [Alkalihalobacillus trypoxylicola]|uniref:S1 motif domain-containing protein n=1 Tax=Alkalihalobacillus trypoxylicola TaxID=519424 RepID=A0A161QNN5_9BACI|nr:S1 RNA-binding domain-containing protein [Alkalihalobacillus trypoxylicola]KYG32003.1 hypothetical protein AZF04_04315 [Alkalihalobacillus trypoxylicola]GAF65990.1 hypothetical protein BTS2_2890 [Bacillus sp. TS-2]